jgi:UV DNA damage repair endonuclease
MFASPEPAKPLNDAQMCGSFYFMTMPTLSTYNRTYKSPEDLVQLLKSRGLTIEDEAKAVQYISSIGYYRLSAYMYPLLSQPKSEHLYKQG